MSDYNVDALNAHFLRVEHIGAEAIIRNYRIGVLFSRFDKLLKSWFSLFFVCLEKLLEGYLLDALLASVLEHSAAEPNIVISVDEDA